MPKVSVIIPVYNTEKYLRKCLDSVCNQTLSDIEIICINDRSLDSSFEILKEFAQQDDRIKLLDFKENKGAAAARNAGLAEVQGEYVGFVDSDDFIDFDFYEKLYTKAKETSADAATGNVYNYNPQTQETYLSEFYNMNDKIRENKAYFHYGFTSAIYSRQLLAQNNIKFPEGIVYFEDPYFSVQVLLNLKNIVIVDDAKYFYTDISQSISRSTLEVSYANDFLLVSKNIAEMLNKSKIDCTSYTIIFQFLYNFCINWLNEKVSNEAKDIVFDSLVYLLDSFLYPDIRTVSFKLQLLPKTYFFKLLRYNSLNNVKAPLNIKRV